MTHVIQIHRHGGPEVMKWEQVDVPDPGPGEVRVRQTGVGLNFVDTYHRTGQMGHPVTFPLILGVQGVGVVEALGPGVDSLSPGDRVAYAGVAGSYAETRVVPAGRMVRLPDDIPDDLAAAAYLRGLTAEYLLRRLYPMQAGETILVHAAAGGAGQIICQWAKALGARVIGTVGTDEKAEFFFFNDTATTEIYTLSLHDALPILRLFCSRTSWSVPASWISGSLFAP